jgi:peroxiredoxin
MTAAPEPGPLPAPPAPRHGLVGPFSGRQLLTVLLVVVLSAVGLALATRPIAPGPDGAITIPESTPFLVGPATDGLRPGDQAPELQVARADGSSVTLTDLDGKPVRLADLRGRLVWLNFWATWCPPCQAETPVLRDMDATYRSRGLSIVGVAVQETTVDDVRAYAQRYELGFDIAFDASADMFGLYKVFALPTQFFVGPDGRILDVINGPMTDETAKALVEAWLPKG